jgi:hypothetical protein
MQKLLSSALRGIPVARLTYASVASAEVCEPFDGEPFSDAELTALALASDPDQPLDPDAVVLDLRPVVFAGALPEWYMPPVMARVSKGWRRPVVFAIVAGFLLIDAFGLCITYGQLVAA